MDLSKVVLLLFALGLAASEAKTNCQSAYKNIPKNGMELCCNILATNLQTFESRCNAFRSSSFYPFVKKNNSTDFENACYIECMWNTAGLLTGGNTFNMQKLASFLVELYKADDKMIEALKQYYKECALNIFDVIPTWQKARVVPDTPDFNANNVMSCSWVPAVTMLCAEKWVFTNCPKNKWRKSAACDKSKTFMMDCLDTSATAQPNGLRVIDSK